MTSVRRTPTLAAVPTLSEAGLPGYEVTQTFGTLATSNTPAAVITKLNGQLNRALKSPDIADTLRAEGGDAVGGPPETYAEYIRREIPKWMKVITQAGIKLE